MRKYDSIENNIISCRNDIDDLKSNQFIGSDSANMYCIQSNNEWDWERTSSSAHEYFDFYLKFMSNSQKAALSIPSITCLINNSTYYTTGNKSNVGINGVWFNGIYYSAYSKSPIDDNPLTEYDQLWYDLMYLINSGINVKLKFKFFSSDIGSAKIKISGTSESIITI